MSIQKPLSLQIKETKDSIFKTINESGLHVSILLLLVSDLQKELARVNDSVMQQEVTTYEKSLETEVGEPTE